MSDTDTDTGGDDRVKPAHIATSVELLQRDISDAARRLHDIDGEYTDVVATEIRETIVSARSQATRLLRQVDTFRQQHGGDAGPADSVPDELEPEDHEVNTETPRALYVASSLTNALEATTPVMRGIHQLDAESELPAITATEAEEHITEAARALAEAQARLDALEQHLLTDQ